MSKEYEITRFNVDDWCFECDTCIHYYECFNPEKRRVYQERTYDYHRGMIEQGMQGVKYKVAILSGKGGVGKSSVSVNVAFALAQQGLAVGVLDSDFHGPSLHKMFGLKSRLLFDFGKGIIPAVGPLGVKIVSVGSLSEGADLFFGAPNSRRQPSTKC